MIFGKNFKLWHGILPGIVFCLLLIYLVYPFQNREEAHQYQVADSSVATSQVMETFYSSLFGPVVNKGRTLTVSDMISPAPKIPADIYRNGPPDHDDLAVFAWLEFISLCAPMGKSRGEPGGSFIESGRNQNATLVWESYLHRSELFPYNGDTIQGRSPSPWNASPRYSMFYTVGKNKEGKNINRPLSVPSTLYNNLLYNNLDEASQIGQNHLFFPKNPGNIDPYQDFQVLFEAKVNQLSWLFAERNYPKFGAFQDYFPNGIDFYPGTIEVKATWRPLASIPPGQQHRYHISAGIYYTGTDDNPQPATGEYALIGLHITHKTPNYPTFIFATFEHVDNLRDPTGRPTGLYYVPSYDNIKYQLPPSTQTDYPIKKDFLNPNYPHGWQQGPYADPSGHSIPLPSGNVSSIPGAVRVNDTTYAVPVKQPPTTNPWVRNVNTQAQNLMRSIPGFDRNFVWQYYKLKGVQGIPTNDQSAPDYYLANIVTESSAPGVQLFAGGQPYRKDTLLNMRNQTNVIDRKQGYSGFNMGGCQGCHGVAQTQQGYDFSFLYFGKTEGFSPDAVGLPSKEVQIDRLRSYLELLDSDSVENKP